MMLVESVLGSISINLYDIFTLVAWYAIKAVRIINTAKTAILLRKRSLVKYFHMVKSNSVNKAAKVRDNL
jgi:uncharacterized membrane protein (GlpM family)